VTRRVLVVGCGNPDAGDDAVGVVAVRRARARLDELQHVRVVEAAIAPDLVDLLTETDAAVLVDAVKDPSGGRPPGTLVRAEAGPDGLPVDVGSSLSSHGFGVGDAVALAAALGRGPAIVFLGVEVAETSVGAPGSTAVNAAIPGLVRAVLAETARLAASA